MNTVYNHVALLLNVSKAGKLYKFCIIRYSILAHKEQERTSLFVQYNINVLTFASIWHWCGLEYIRDDMMQREMEGRLIERGEHIFFSLACACVLEIRNSK